MKQRTGHGDTWPAVLLPPLDGLGKSLPLSELKSTSCFPSLWGCDKGRLGQWCLGKCFPSQSDSVC